MNPEHPKKLEDGWAKDAVDAVKQLFSKGLTLVRNVKHKYLLIKDGSASVVDYDELPDDKKEEYRFKNKNEKLSRGSDTMQNSRYDTYSGQSPGKIADRASDNPYILGDILDDPGLVDASGETEAVAKVAEHNPGWAKISDAVESHDLDVDADGNVSSTSEGSSGGGDSVSAAEAASDAASYGGDVSTADAGDIGPTGASGYGIDGGADAGGSAGSGDGGGLGGDAGGGDL